jgi:hypothetical protein
MPEVQQRLWSLGARVHPLQPAAHVHREFRWWHGWFLGGSMSDVTYLEVPGLTRYECTSGGAQYCQGCYTMTPDQYGDFVTFEDYAALLARCQAAENAIHDHNEACLDLCGRGDQEAVRCQYRQYLLHSGRRCPECPRYNMIDLPTGSASANISQGEG